ncbi:hypothetical protein [Devosia sp. A369]
MNKENAFGTVTGAAGITFPWWNEFVHAATGANQAFVVVMGAIVLILTARKLWLKGKIASRKLRDLDRNA